MDRVKEIIEQPEKYRSERGRLYDHVQRHGAEDYCEAEEIYAPPGGIIIARKDGMMNVYNPAEALEIMTGERVALMPSVRTAKTIRKQGNSYGVAITKQELEAIGAAAGDTVEVVIRPITPVLR